MRSIGQRAQAGQVPVRSSGSLLRRCRLREPPSGTFSTFERVRRPTDFLGGFECTLAASTFGFRCLALGPRGLIIPVTLPATKLSYEPFEVWQPPTRL